MVQLSHLYMTFRQNIALTRRTLVIKVMSLHFNMLSRLVIAFLPKSKHLLISWLLSPSAVILEPKKRVCHYFHCFPIYLPRSDGTRYHDLILWMLSFKAAFSLSSFISSVQSLSHFRLFWPHEPQHARPPCPSSIPGVYPNPCPLCRWCHPTTSSSLVPFSSCLQSFPASGSFQMSQLFTSAGQSMGLSASTSVLPVNIQDWFPLGWTGWISLQSKELSRVIFNTTVQKHQLFSAQYSL